MAIRTKIIHELNRIAVRGAAALVHKGIMPARGHTLLDEDETEELAKLFKIELDNLNGNITIDEHKNKIDKLLGTIKS